MRRLLALAMMLAAAPALAQDEDYVFEAELIHAPVPLYTFDWEEVWPHKAADDAHKGARCTSRVASGTWQFRSNPEDEYADDWWWRVGTNDTFGCVAGVLEADTRKELAEGLFTMGLFAVIGEGRVEGRAWELWVLQKGFVPGSDYVLLAREAEGGDLVRRFTVLQRRCPRGNVREASGMDVWTTRYCAVENRAELLALARRMLREKPLGTLELAEDKNEEGPDTEASDPSD